MHRRLIPWRCAAPPPSASGASSAVTISKAPSSEKWPRADSPASTADHRAGAEDQRRNAQRQHQQDQQHAAAAQAQRQRRAQAAEQAEHRRAQQQRRASARRCRPRAHVEQQARTAAPPAPAAGRSPPSAPAPWPAAISDGRLAGQQHLLERAVGMVAARRAGSPTASRRAARTPTPRPGAIWRSVCGSGPTPSGNRLDRDDEKDQRQQRLDAAARGQPQVAREDGGERHGSSRRCTPSRLQRRPATGSRKRQRRMMAGQHHAAAARGMLAQSTSSSMALPSASSAS